MERAAGNPLFLRELASVGEKSEDAEDLPDTVEALVATRIDQLAPGDRALLRWASVLGVSFSGSLIAEVLEGDTDVASRLGGVGPARRIRRARSRSRRAPSASATRSSETRRTRGSRSSAAENSTAESPRSSKLIRASDPRLQSSSRCTTTVLGTPPSRGSTRSRPANGRKRNGRMQRPSSSTVGRSTWPRPCRSFPRSRSPASGRRSATACTSSAASMTLRTRTHRPREFMPKGTTEQIELMRTQGLLRDDMGRYPDALRWYTRALKATEAIPDEDARSRLRIRLRLALAQTRYRQGAFTDCIRRFKEVVQECLAVGDSANLAPAYLILHLVHTQLGSRIESPTVDSRWPCTKSSGTPKGQASALNNMGIDAYYEGDWESAVDRYERSRKLYERIGDAPNVGITANNVGEILSDQGRLEEAEAMFEAVLHDAEVMGHRFLILLARSNLGRVAARAGRFAEAQEQLEQAVEIARESVHRASCSRSTCASRSRRPARRTCGIRHDVDRRRARTLNRGFGHGPGRSSSAARARGRAVPARRAAASGRSSRGERSNRPRSPGPLRARALAGPRGRPWGRGSSS